MFWLEGKSIIAESWIVYRTEGDKREKEISYEKVYI